jgi:hypothetical protein
MCVECLSTIRDVSSGRHPTSRPAACPRRLRARDEDGWTGAAPPTVTPAEFQSGTNAHEHRSCHVRHHPTMGTADVNRCSSVQSLMVRSPILVTEVVREMPLVTVEIRITKRNRRRGLPHAVSSVISITSLSCLRRPSVLLQHVSFSFLRSCIRQRLLSSLFTSVDQYSMNKQSELKHKTY